MSDHTVDSEEELGHKLQVNKVWEAAHGPHVVFFSMEVLNIGEICCHSQTFECNLEITLSWMMTQYDKENTGYAQWKPEWAPAGLKITKLQKTKIMNRGPYLRKEMLGMAMIEQTTKV
jgi:hypothetical protein